MTATVAPPLLDDEAHGAGGVVDRYRLELGMRGQEAGALRERDRMRVDASDIAELHAARRDEVVHDAQVRLAGDGEPGVEQQVP